MGRPPIGSLPLLAGVALHPLHLLHDLRVDCRSQTSHFSALPLEQGLSPKTFRYICWLVRSRSAAANSATSLLIAPNSCPIRVPMTRQTFALGLKRKRPWHALARSAPPLPRTPSVRLSPAQLDAISGMAKYQDFGVVIQPNGAKSFIVQRGVAGKTIRRTLGLFPEMTLAEARRLAEEPLATIRAGRNPNAERKAQREAEAKERRQRITCSQLWRSYEIEVIAKKNRPSTAMLSAGCGRRRLSLSSAPCMSSTSRAITYARLLMAPFG